MTTAPIDFANHEGNGTLAKLAPWISRLFLAPPVLITILISLRYITNPSHAASATGVVLSTPEAWTDTRVVGAMVLTLSFAIASSFISLHRLRIGHAVVIMLMVSVLAVRLFGFAHDGTTLAMGDQRVKTFGEILFALLNTAGLLLQTYVVKPLGAK